MATKWQQLGWRVRRVSASYSRAVTPVMTWIVGTAVTLVLLWLFGTLPPNDGSDWPWFGGIIGCVFIFSALAYYGAEGREEREPPKWLILPTVLIGLFVVVAGIGGGLVLIYAGLDAAISEDDVLQGVFLCGGGAMLVLGTLGWLGNT